MIDLTHDPSVPLMSNKGLHPFPSKFAAYKKSISVPDTKDIVGLIIRLRNSTSVTDLISECIAPSASWRDSLIAPSSGCCRVT
ncbi:hypothetical protein TNCV_3530331 [Trichonephila clavipes]|uniref:Uncharacterized protein n=1 Tax=Trichonephila clavipes TaxID=2585209 RepID=A0A8X6RFY8_TRICX|nr:hypothetical protein TNCV_3530331 [Trichonephila clavipes]